MVAQAWSSSYVYIDLPILLPFNYCTALCEADTKAVWLSCADTTTSKGSPYLMANQPKALSDLAKVHCQELREVHMKLDSEDDGPTKVKHRFR